MGAMATKKEVKVEGWREQQRGIEEEWSSINNCAEVGDAGGQQFSPNTVIITNELRSTAIEEAREKENHEDDKERHNCLRTGCIRCLII
ncbi:hypothetical protein M9458_024632, partial [Cirrhinus mrigala]